jgi:YD repeat-containing protein
MTRALRSFASRLALAVIGTSCGATSSGGSAGATATASSPDPAVHASAVCPDGLQGDGDTWMHAVLPGCTSMPYIVPFPVCDSGKDCPRPCRVTNTSTGTTGRTTEASTVHYDARGRFTGTTGRLSYRWLLGFDRCSYEGDRLVSCDYANQGGHETYRYDSKGRLVGVHSAEDWAFDWGPDGVVAARVNGVTRYSFAYDGQHRLVEWSLGDGSAEATLRTKLEYDARGRLTKSTVVHMTGIADPEALKRAMEPHIHRYDESGHLIDDGNGTQYDWDDRGRLVREHHANVDVTWEYDCSDAPAR